MCNQFLHALIILRYAAQYKLALSVYSMSFETLSTGSVAKPMASGR